jgi:hypothetical protein
MSSLQNNDTLLGRVELKEEVLQWPPFQRLLTTCTSFDILLSFLPAAGLLRLLVFNYCMHLASLSL